MDRKSDENENAAISLATPKREDIEATKRLEKALNQCNAFESNTALNHRLSILAKLNTLFNTFIYDISISQNVSVEKSSRCGRVLAFGSYRLGVNLPDADIDALCIAPRNITRTLFFTMFTNLLKKQPEVTECKAIGEAFVPLIEMKFDGIEIDLLFACLPLKKIPKDLDLGDDMLLLNLEQKCVRSLNGCRVADEILKLVPNVTTYRLALRAIKFWATQRGIYSSALGYFCGVSLAILVARICQLNPNAAAATIVQNFFVVFSQWAWPKPVLLKELHNANLGFRVWNPRTSLMDRAHIMPIITPTYPQQNPSFRVSSSTLHVIQMELKRGVKITGKILTNEATWERLFKK